MRAIGSKLNLTALGAFSLAGIAMAGPQATGDNARDLLLRYLEKGRYVTMRAIVEQTSSFESRRTLQLKIEQDSKGRRKATVLQPLSMQNIVSLDDTKKWFNYHPDENRIYVQDSPTLRAEDPKAKMALASQNYIFSIEKCPDIAGRSAAMVVASPKHAGMPTRMYCIEYAKNVLLRLEVEIGPNQRKLLFDTKAIAFPPRLPEDTFEIRPVGEVRVIEKPTPTRIGSREAAIAATGIAPILPANLPFGFVARDPELTGEEDQRMIAVRLTDGLVYATVYQWGARGGPSRFDSKDSRFAQTTVNGVRMKIVGDLPEEVRMKLLEAFAREAAGALVPVPELASSRSLLNRSQDSLGAGNANTKPSQHDSLDSLLGDPALASVLAQVFAALGESHELDTAE